MAQGQNVAVPIVYYSQNSLQITSSGGSTTTISHLAPITAPPLVNGIHRVPLYDRVPFYEDTLHTASMQFCLERPATLTTRIQKECTCSGLRVDQSLQYNTTEPLQWAQAANSQNIMVIHMVPPAPFEGLDCTLAAPRTESDQGTYDARRLMIVGRQRFCPSFYSDCGRYS
jgi:hypothetical protein